MSTADRKVNDLAMNRFQPFLEEVLAGHRELLHSVCVTGSALTADYNSKTSDINSVFILKQMDLQFLAVLAPLGRKYGRKGIAAPLIMTPAYIRSSLDVFPIEFLNIRLLHQTVFGEDIFQDIEIKPSDLRHQCERELKVKTMALRQAYIKSAGDTKMLLENIIPSLSAYLPLFRAIVLLKGEDPPIDSAEVLAVLQQKTGIDTRPFRMVLKLKKERSRLSLQALNDLFGDTDRATEKLGDMLDAHTD